VHLSAWNLRCEIYQRIHTHRCLFEQNGRSISFVGLLFYSSGSRKERDNDYRLSLLIAVIAKGTAVRRHLPCVASLIATKIWALRPVAVKQHLYLSDIFCFMLCNLQTTLFILTDMLCLSHSRSGVSTYFGVHEYISEHSSSKRDYLNDGTTYH
jgi:hypothetical protein